jgi:transcriptional regulator
MAIFTGPDAYVSPSMYPSKRIDGRVVPTWNYARIEARGRLFVEAGPTAVRPYLQQLIAELEGDRTEPWGLDDAPAGYVQRLEAAIVGLRFEVDDVAGALKLSQNRTPEDYAGVRDALAASPTLSDRAVSEMMTHNARLD